MLKYECLCLSDMSACPRYYHDPVMLAMTGGLSVCTYVGTKLVQTVPMRLGSWRTVSATSTCVGDGCAVRASV